jgi:hypothetical protein
MALQRGFRFYLWQLHGLSARAEFRGESATENIRKFVFPEVLFDSLPSTNRSFFACEVVLRPLDRFKS